MTCGSKQLVQQRLIICCVRLSESIGGSQFNAMAIQDGKLPTQRLCSKLQPIFMYEDYD